MTQPLTGLIAATYTPMHEDGSLNLDAVPAMVNHLERSGVRGIYICGSTGEGVSLTGVERCDVAEAYISAAKGRLRTIVQVGHNSIAEARQLASHAQRCGADAFSAIPPFYYKIETMQMLVDCAAQIAGGAPELPFYYYHIPAFTGTSVDMVDFMSAAGLRIPNLVGLKYTAHKVFEFQACRELNNGRFDVVWGADEMLLAGLAVGARGAIGSTYNIAAPLYRDIIDAYDRQDMELAQELQMRSVALVRLLNKYPFHAATKVVLELYGLEAGPCREPLASLSKAQKAQLAIDLEESGCWEWLRPGEAAATKPKHAVSNGVAARE
ncbi:dihydrodipicolinate synthase family protein [Lacipirellula parvula]|uniref:N-acetylneuraminate lyase n=1 Tax=Lacipirellula parvula TaxID=2650471 RepID=A0A5K7XNC7_9BACT|nr:dihydrodipicolinate synthase family protein [Lacipirellula parvula]BBO34639.1 N-acetylneuraminate lyase [Lacipirellula parvula]